MKTIVHLIPTLEGGGAERQLALLAAEQAARGLDVHIGSRRGGVHAAHAERAGVHLHALGDRRSVDPRLVASMHALLRRARADLVQTWLPQADVCGGIAARLAGVPWVMTERASASEYRGHALLTLARPRLARRAAAIVANSATGAAYWRAAPRGLEARVIGNALDADTIRAQVAAGAATARSGPALLLSVGRLVAGKGHEEAIAACAAQAAGSVELQVVGAGPRHDALAALAAASGCARLTGYDADWWRRLGGARALLYLSHGEGAPNVVLETMAAGVPLVVSDIAAHRELLDERSALFVPPGDRAAAASALRTLLHDPTAAAQRAAVARARADAFGIARMADAYASVYNRVLDGVNARCAA
jgi:glycosyltransferase involved in cell wall biosynthesis